MAYFSPLPPARSGIADYSAELLPYLAERADVTLFADTSRALNLLVSNLESPISTLSLQSTAAYPAMRWQFDATLYHMGNSDHHWHIYQLLTRYPGVVVVHDVFIHQLLAHQTVGQERYAAYSREMGLAQGIAGIHQANAIRAGYGTHPLFEVPLTERLVRSSLGLIVHSHYAAALLARQRPRGEIKVIPAPIAPSDTPGRHLRRREVGIPDDAVLFASVGQVTQNKQADQLLRVFQQLQQENPNTYLLFVGEMLAEVGLAEIVRDLGLEQVVGVVGYVETLAAFVDWIHTADVLINLRHPTLGETSATALRGLAAGRPLVVFDQGWYRELPDTVALKIPAMDEAAMLQAMRSLAASPDLRRQMGEAAGVYARHTHHPAQVAEQYIYFLQQLISQWRQPRWRQPYA